MDASQHGEGWKIAPSNECEQTTFSSEAHGNLTTTSTRKMSMEIAAAPARTEVWVCLVGAITSERATAIECNPEVTSFDKLMKLVKAEFQPKLDAIAAPDLKVTKNAGGYWQSDEKVSVAGPLGARAATPLEVEVPVPTSGE